MSAIGVFVIGNVVNQLSAFSRRESRAWQMALAATRYLSYRGFRVEVFGWNSASIGLLFFGAAGAVFFAGECSMTDGSCTDLSEAMDLAPSPYYWPGMSMVWGNSPPLGTRSGWLALACMPFLL